MKQIRFFLAITIFIFMPQVGQAFWPLDGIIEYFTGSGNEPKAPAEVKKEASPTFSHLRQELVLEKSELVPVIQPLAEVTDPEKIMKVLHQRLVGVPLLLDDPYYSEYLSLAQAQQFDQLAKVFVEKDRFLSITVHNFASLYWSMGKTLNLDLQDAIATLIGSVKDNRDAREILTANSRYTLDPRVGETPRVPGKKINEDFLGLQEKVTLNLLGMWALRHQEPQWPYADVPDASGLLTSYSFTEEFLKDGTNRREIKGALEMFLCQPIENWRDATLPDTFVRRDIDRQSGGNVDHFTGECNPCHAPMDPLSNAFAMYDLQSDRLQKSKDVIQKYLQNPTRYSSGYIPTDDTWVNLLTTPRHQKTFGWRGPTSGRGIQSFGKMLADSEQFSRCMVQRVAETVCWSALEQEESSRWIEANAKVFENKGYGMKDLFLQIATQKECFQ